MGAVIRAFQPRSRRLLAKLEGRSQELVALLILQDHFPRGELGLIERRTQIVDGRPAHIQGGKKGLPMGPRGGGEGFLEKGHHRGLPRPRLTAEVNQIFPIQRPQQRLNELHLHAAQHQIQAVLAAVDTVEGIAAPNALLRGHRGALLREGRPQGVRHAEQDGIHHGQVEVIPAPRLTAAIEGHGNACHGVGGRQHVPGGHGRQHGATVPIDVVG